MEMMIMWMMMMIVIIIIQNKYLLLIVNFVLPSVVLPLQIVTWSRNLGQYSLDFSTQTKHSGPTHSFSQDSNSETTNCLLSISDIARKVNRFSFHVFHSKSKNVNTSHSTILVLVGQCFLTSVSSTTNT